MYVDMHAHILPGADHGSDGLETSLSQLQYAVTANVDTVLATPHFYRHADTVDSFLERRERCFDLLCDKAPVELRKQLHLYLGAEVTLEVDLDSMEGLEKLCIGDTNNILIEMPFSPWTPWVFTSLRNMIALRGLRPIVAHVDRYMENPGLKELLSMNLPLQVNAEAFEKFGRRHRVMKLFENGSAQFLGSDIHMADPTAYQRFSKAVRYLGDSMKEVTEASRVAVGQKKPDRPFRAVRII